MPRTLALTARPAIIRGVKPARRTDPRTAVAAAIARLEQGLRELALERRAAWRPFQGQAARSGARADRAFSTEHRIAMAEMVVAARPLSHGAATPAGTVDAVCNVVDSRGLSPHPGSRPLD